jgi:hypothetical protein
MSLWKSRRASDKNYKRHLLWTTEDRRRATPGTVVA